MAKVPWKILLRSASDLIVDVNNVSHIYGAIMEVTTVI
jgi:hypothetical protein